MFLDAFFLQILEHFSSTPSPQEEGEGEVVGNRYVFGCIFLQILKLFSSTPTPLPLPLPPSPTPLVLGQRSKVRGER